MTGASANTTVPAIKQTYPSKRNLGGGCPVSATRKTSFTARLPTNAPNVTEMKKIGSATWPMRARYQWLQGSQLWYCFGNWGMRERTYDLNAASTK